MYLARDKNHDLSLFNELPRRGNECWWAESGVDGTDLKLDKALYPRGSLGVRSSPGQLDHEAGQGRVIAGRCWPTINLSSEFC